MPLPFAWNSTRCRDLRALVRKIKLPADLSEQIEQLLEDAPELSWDQALAKLAGDGQWTDHDRRCHHAISNSYRLTLRELSTAPKPKYRNGQRDRYADPHAEITKLVAERRAQKAQPEAAK